MENMHTDIRVLGVLRVLRVNKHFLSKRGITRHSTIYLKC